jgi:hypothetical protein
MSSNQRSQPNNQSSNGGNEKTESSSRGGKDRNDNMTNNAFDSDTMQQSEQSQQSGSQSGSQQQGSPGQRQSNDVAGGLPKSPGGKRLAADQDMDDDTGLSNRGNRQSAEDIDEGTRQSGQSNVGRRDDGTPD